MKKVKTSFTLSHDALELLKTLAEKNGRSGANMLEQIIKEEAARQKVKAGKKK